MFEFKAFKRPSLVDMGVDPVREALLNELRSIGRAMKKDMEQVFQTWSKKPEVHMKIHLTRTDPQAGIDIYVQSEVVYMLDKGTKDHYVRPKKSKRLAWQTQFTQKTIKGQLRSQPGGKSGNNWATSQGHWIKGVEARGWEKALAEKWDKPMTERLQAAANKGAAKARRI